MHANTSTLDGGIKGSVALIEERHGRSRAVIEGIDHCTYVDAADNESDFIRRWAALGFSEVVRLRTRRFPASHIALTTAVTTLSSPRVMTGLSVSDDPSSPINEFVRRYGAGLQHVAYRVAIDVDFDDLSGWLEATGLQLMTAPLRYVGDGGAELDGGGDGSAPFSVTGRGLATSYSKPPVRAL